MEEMISLDLGKNGGLAYWDFTLPIKKSCTGVKGWDLGLSGLMSAGLFEVIRDIEDYLQERRGDITVEKPGRHLPYQWILYTDIKILATKYKVGFHEYHPITIKKVVTGNGRAEKDEIQEVMSKIIKLPKAQYTEHMYDAISVGICHLKKVGIL